jgi:uncharacterized protein (DUF1015 family)
MNVRAFRGLRPRADLAARIPSLPYDVLDSSEARALAQGDPYTFLHVVKAEIDLAPGLDPHDDRVYAKARENFLAMRRNGWLVRDERPAIYLYRLRMGDHVQTGIVGAASVEDYLDGRIKKHEHTRPDKEDDRTRHTDAIGAHPGPVFLAYRGRPALDALVGDGTRRAPAADFVAADGVSHTFWVVVDPLDVQRFEAALSEVPASYIADGHHRAAAYARVANLHPGRADRFLSVHFPAEQLRILAYNRLVRDLNGLDQGALLRKIDAAGFDRTTPWAGTTPQKAASFGMYLAGGWHLFVARPQLPSDDDPVKRLDVALLQDRILGPVLGVGDPRTDPRISFCGGIRGAAELTRRVDSGEAAVAFSMYPTSLDDVMRVADAGRVMPPKSTWFEPKLRSGMVVHLLDEP